MALVKVGKAGHHPIERRAELGKEHDLAASPRTSKTGRPGSDALQSRRDRASEIAARISEEDGPVSPLEETDSQVVLQRSDLAAYGSLGQVQLLSGPYGAPEPGGILEG